MTTPLEQLKLPLRVRRIIQRCRNGYSLVLTNVNLQGGGVEKVYTYHRASGRRVPTVSAEEAIASGELVANDDGLFAETSQTWRAKP